MDDNSGICYTWSGDKKIYESGELSISPDKVKFVDFYNSYAKPFIQYIFTSSNNPPGISLEEGTTMYTVGLRDSDIDINNYLTYTPPDGYELVSEDNKNDPGVKEYYMSKKFYCDPSITVYYGTAAKSFTYLTGGKTFYYKEIPSPPPPPDDEHAVIYVILDIGTDSQGFTTGTINCECEAVPDWLIPGTNNGNDTLGVRVQLTDGVDSSNDEVFYFSWVMKYGINESRSCRPIRPYYFSSAYFTTKSDGWVTEHSDGHKTYWEFDLTLYDLPI